MSTARILVVEDNPANLELVRYLLTAMGHAPALAVDGAEGLAQARLLRPHLIISDLQMPEMDGYTLIRALREDPLLRDTVVAALTALSMPGDRDAVLKAGFDAYFAKPLDPETFCRDIAALLARVQGTGGEAA